MFLKIIELKNQYMKPLEKGHVEINVRFINIC